MFVLKDTKDFLIRVKNSASLSSSLPPSFPPSCLPFLPAVPPSLSTFLTQIGVNDVDEFCNLDICPYLPLS